MIYIGIDTGVHTGVAVWDGEEKCFKALGTMKIHEAMAYIKDTLHFQTLNSPEMKLKVFFEDARMRKWVKYSGNEKAERGRCQGAGSVKRDCQIWEDFLKGEGIDYEAVAPKNNRTKLKSEAFARDTGWKGRTSEHARDAAMLVFGK